MSEPEGGVDEPGEEHGLRVIRRQVPAHQPSDDVTVVAAAAVTVLGAGAFAVAVLVDATVEWQLGSLAVAALAFLVGLRRYFAAVYPQVEAAEPRPDLEAGTAPVRDVVPVSRRRLLARLLGGAAAALGLGALIPISSLGPRYRPPESGWGQGVRLVGGTGEFLRPENLPPGGVAVVWPEGELRREHASVILVRLSAAAEEPTRRDWVVNDTVVAYSKVCTHAGCPVGLFRESDNTLFCPCHQSSFDAARGAAPTFGPVSRPLPQLPLGVDDDGHLVALGDFEQPVGPARG